MNNIMENTIYNTMDNNCVEGCVDNDIDGIDSIYDESPSISEAIEFLEDLQKIIPIYLIRNGIKIPIYELIEDDLYLSDDNTFFEMARLDDIVIISPIELFDCYNISRWTLNGFYLIVHNKAHNYTVSHGQICECDRFIPSWFYDKYNRGTNEFEDYIELGG